MPIHSGFFNSVNGDRKYDATWFARFFASFIGNGVFPNPSTGMQVVEGSNMQTIVKAGEGWINGYYIVNDGNYTLQHDIADGVLKRIDRVVMRLNFLTRQIEVLIKKGAYGSTPVAPVLQRNADAHELALADVLINNGATVITQANITDQRLNSALCGIVHGVVDQVDTTTIFNQYQAWYGDFTTDKQAEFDEWIATLQDILSGDVAGNLLNLIETNTETIDNHINDVSSHVYYSEDTGTANLKVLTIPGITAWKKGLRVSFFNKVANTGTVQININGLGALLATNAKGLAFKAGDMKLNQPYEFIFNGGSFILKGEGGEYGTALPKDVLLGKTLGTEDGVVPGTLVAYQVGDKVPQNKVNSVLNTIFTKYLNTYRSADGLAMDRHGNLYTVHNDGQLIKFDKNGNQLQLIQIKPVGQSGNDLSGLCLAGDYLAFADTTGLVYKYDIRTMSQVWTIDTGAYPPTGLLINESGEIFYANWAGSVGTLRKVLASGANSWGHTMPSVNVSSMTFMSDGSILCADTSENIYKVDMLGNRVWTFAVNKNTYGDSLSAEELSNGYIAVVCTLSVIKLSPTGTVSSWSQVIQNKLHLWFNSGDMRIVADSNGGVFFVIQVSSTRFDGVSYFSYTSIIYGRLSSGLDRIQWMEATDQGTSGLSNLMPNKMIYDPIDDVLYLAVGAGASGSLIKRQYVTTILA